MNYKSTAVIIDKNIEKAQLFSGLISPELLNISFITDFLDAQKLIQEIQPRIVFVCLNLNQRADCFDLLQILAKKPSAMTIYGYSEHIGPELITHSLENGVQEIFTSPFDSHRINVKILSELNTAKGNEEFNSIPLNPPLKAFVQIEMTIQNVNENGVTFKSSHYISKGTIFSSNANIIQDIFGKEQTLMITKTWPGVDWREYYLYAEPTVTNDMTSTALKQFIAHKNEQSKHHH